MDNEVGPVQSIGGFIALGLGVWGFLQASWAGAITGIVAGMAGASGFAISYGEKGTGTAPEESSVGLWQRIGGFTATILVIAGVYFGGWTWGWAWAVGGYVAGMLVAFLGGAMTSSRQSNPTDDN